MPEGDTVWQTARRLDEALAGRPLARADFRVPQLATDRLAGWRVAGAVSRGKHLLLRLHPPAAESAEGTGAEGTEGGYSLHSHLRMDGAWRLYRPGQRWTGGPAHQIRVVLHGASAVAVGYHLHDVALVPTAREDTLVGHLGPDLLAVDFDAAEALRRLRAAPGALAVDALRDQRNLAGIGNVYAAELLFLHGVPPDAPLTAVPDLPALVADARRLLLANRDRRRSTTGSRRPDELTFVYGRRGRPCHRCGTPVRQGAHGDRVSYWCPRCQPPAGS
ncbi:putative endonuclease 8 2 [Pilimelia terevasa]|uniref:DNA-(apurinic or apyrimidinic site) lyase n=1 Tax=Pilimelia terevasa TaxID=53372 RepID=A0A8J3BPY5_9ACTN|nr:Fpg/Nei family DNA glycosylase [Pilimelia terevasa]GGK27563.1 putative endonuclease 8 2 [Pilimelia terevasa]